MSSTVEAELGALFINAKEAAVNMPRMLSEMGHLQPRTPIQTDNSTAEGVINSRIRQRQTKRMDMRFEWLYDKFGRLFHKTSPSHHRNVRGEFSTRVAKLQRLHQAGDKSSNNRRNHVSNVLCKGVLITS